MPSSDKAIEGLVLFAFNQGEVCTCPSRALIQESDLRQVHGTRAEARGRHQTPEPAGHRQHDGRQASKEQLTKILSYLELGKQEGAKCWPVAASAHLGGDLEGGYHVQPTLFKGHNKMRIFQEEIFGPVLAVTTFKDDEAEAWRLPTTPCTAWAPVCGAATATSPTAWAAPSRPGACDQLLPRLLSAHAAFGGYKGNRALAAKTHKMMLDHYQQTKNLLVSYSENKLGFF